MMRSLSPRAFAIIAAASLLLGAHWIAAAQEENPFRGHSDTGEILHVDGGFHALGVHGGAVAKAQAAAAEGAAEQP